MQSDVEEIQMIFFIRKHYAIMPLHYFLQSMDFFFLELYICCKKILCFQKILSFYITLGILAVTNQTNCYRVKCSYIKKIFWPYCG